MTSFASLGVSGVNSVLFWEAPGDSFLGALYLDNLPVGSLSGSAVPEPMSWAPMLGGLGLIGGALRRRRQVAVSYA